MKILIIGSGGREHAIAWKLSGSSACPKLYIAPGNAGTLAVGENVDLNINDFSAIKNFCIAKEIEMVVVGPEEPLVNGIFDFFRNDELLKNIIITGPSAEGARLEGSKAFAKAFMKRHDIPTAAYREFQPENFDEGLDYLREHSLPVVLKADGLAAGKGVVICQTTSEAIEEFSSMLLDEKFGKAGKKVVVEQFLDGIELSVFVLTDGVNFVLLPEAKDYKKIGEGDTGPNTGGMGAVSPVPFATDHFIRKVNDRIIMPTIKGLRQEGIHYKGFIFFGLIKVNDEPYIIEYNCRLGDPETEAIMLRMNVDLVELFKAMHRGTLGAFRMEINKNHVATIMAVSGGYPMHYEKGFPVSFNFLKNPQEIKHITEEEGVIVFHAGTKKSEEQVVTNGGRVLAVSAEGSDLADALQIAAEVMEQIHFEGMYYRKDIGNEFVK